MLIFGRFKHYVLWCGRRRLCMRYSLALLRWWWRLNISAIHTCSIRYGSYLRTLFVYPPILLTRWNDFHELWGPFNDYPKRICRNAQRRMYCVRHRKCFFPGKREKVARLLENRKHLPWMNHTVVRANSWKRRQMLHKQMQSAGGGRNGADVCKQSTFHRVKRAYSTIFCGVEENSCVTHIRLAYKDQTKIIRRTKNRMIRCDENFALFLAVRKISSVTNEIMHLLL